MDLVVFGANGPTGRQVALRALAAGHHVTAVTRKPDRYALSSPYLDVAGADVTDLDGVGQAIAGCQAVISTFGVPYSKEEITIYSRGITNITRAMAIHGVTRLVCVSSQSVTTDEAPSEPLFFRKVVDPLVQRVGRTLYDDMQRMEAIVQGSGLDWTIVRPGGLFDAAEVTDDYQVASKRLPVRVTSRADLADTLINEATSPRHSGLTIDVITTSGTPSFLHFFKEAFGIGK